MEVCAYMGSLSMMHTQAIALGQNFVRAQENPKDEAAKHKSALERTCTHTSTHTHTTSHISTHAHLVHTLTYVQTRVKQVCACAHAPTLRLLAHAPSQS